MISLPVLRHRLQADYFMSNLQTGEQLQREGVKRKRGGLGEVRSADELYLYTTDFVCSQHYGEYITDNVVLTTMSSLILVQ